MRSTIVIALACLLYGMSAVADDSPRLAKAVKASLVFQDESKPNPSPYDYPHILRVFLRLENVHDSDIWWVADSVCDVEAELLDSAGKPVPQGFAPCSILSNTWAYLLPYGSRLDWLISHGGITLGNVNERRDKYALMVGGQGWLIPIKSLGLYSLRIRLRGIPWEQTPKRGAATVGKTNPLLLDVPATKLAL